MHRVITVRSALAVIDALFGELPLLQKGRCSGLLGTVLAAAAKAKSFPPERKLIPNPVS
jgi:hypothetical protein